MVRIFTLITFIGVMFGVNCYGQATITYTPQTNVFIVGTPISSLLTPTVTGKQPTAYAINPQLPTGLTFNTSTGAISGNPTAVSPAADYIIKATSLGGTSTFTLHITINPPAPSISYNAPNVLFTMGIQIAPPLIPTVTGGQPTAYAINPQLSTGLTFNTSTGAIEGNPTAISAATDYTITATNAGGSGTFKLNVAVAPQTSYPDFKYTIPTGTKFTVNTSIPVLYPTGKNITSATTYTISPQLPAGLIFEPGTGVIHGTPSGVSSGNYLVTATDPTTRYSNTSSVQIIVYPSQPGISYPSYNTFIAGVTIGNTPAGTNTVSPANAHNQASTQAPNTNSTGTPSAVANNQASAQATSANSTGTLPTVANNQVSAQTPNANSTGTKSANTVKKPTSSGNSTKQSWIRRALTRYQDTDVYNRLGIPIPRLRPQFDPNTSMPTGYSINSALPDGLNFSMVTGEITGTPTKVTTPTKYTITAYYQANPSNTFDVTIAVIPNPDVDTTDATIEFVGQGDIQQSINTGSSIAANTGLGVIYRENSNRHYGIIHNIELDFSINVASTVDTVRSNYNSITKMPTNVPAFGNSVLLPLNSGQAFSFSFTGYLTRKGPDGNFYRNAAPKPLLGIISGFKVDIAGSNRTWELDSVTSVANNTSVPINTVKASMVRTYAGIFYEFITPTAKNNYGQNASATLGIGWSDRYLLGDAAQEINSEKFFGTKTRITSFFGPEIQMALRFYNIKASVSIPFISSKASVPGLTGTQTNTFIGFSGGFPIDLTKKTTSTTP